MSRSAEVLLAELDRAGVVALLDHGIVKLVPGDRIPPDLLSELRERKLEILELLSGQPEDVEPVPPAIDVAAVWDLLAAAPRNESELVAATGWNLERLWNSLGDLIDSAQVVKVFTPGAKRYTLATETNRAPAQTAVGSEDG